MTVENMAKRKIILNTEKKIKVIGRLYRNVNHSANGK
jgi:hypothetical protein